MIRPPFPFPSKWRKIDKLQKVNNEEFWSVSTKLLDPTYPVLVLPSSSSTTNEVVEDFPVSSEEYAEEWEEGSELEMNEVWAEWFARSLVAKDNKRKSTAAKSQKRWQKFIQKKNKKKSRKTSEQNNLMDRSNDIADDMSDRDKTDSQ
jgi:hypothetical protein